MTALSGRPTRPRPVHRSLAIAVAFIAIGIVAITAAQPNGDRVQPAFMVGGILAVVIGVVLASPGAIRALAVPARHLPFAPRLALRDLVRYQTRAAAALTAITLALGISVTVVVISKANTPSSDQGNLSDRQLFVSVGDPRTAPSPTLDADERARLDALAATVAHTVGSSKPLTLNVAINPTTAGDPNIREPITVDRPIDGGFRLVSPAYVATPQILARYGIEQASIDDETDLLTSHSGTVVLLDSSVRDLRDTSTTPVQRVDLSSFTTAPTSLVTKAALRRNGWVTARAGWLVESSTPLTAEQIDTARATAAAAGLTVEVRTSADAANTLRTVATIVGAMLALAIVAMTIGLIRSEAAGELRTLTATGASPRTRRTLTASTAGALALLGVLLGAGGAYIALLAGYHADLSKLARPPFVNLLVLAIGLPLIAAGAGWLLAGREPKAFARQALD